MFSIYLIVASIVANILGLLRILLVVRAIMSWFPEVMQSQIGQFVRMITEPILIPCRALLNKIPALQGLPLDLSVLLAFILLQIFSQLLYF